MPERARDSIRYVRLTEQEDLKRIDGSPCRLTKCEGS